MTVSHIASRSTEPARPAPVAPKGTHSYVIVAVNADTEIDAKWLSAGTVSIKLGCPITGSVTQIDLPEADLLRLWFHAETARRSGAGR